MTLLWLYSIRGERDSFLVEQRTIKKLSVVNRIAYVFVSKRNALIAFLKERVTVVFTFSLTQWRAAIQMIAKAVENRNAYFVSRQLNRPSLVVLPSICSRVQRIYTTNRWLSPPLSSPSRVSNRLHITKGISYIISSIVGPREWEISLPNVNEIPVAIIQARLRF